MSRYGIDTNSFTQSLLGGAAIGQRTIGLAQDQQALLERLRQNQQREEMGANTARYLQTIFSGGQLPAGFDAGTVDPSAIQTGAQWGEGVAQRQADIDLLRSIETGTPFVPDRHNSPQLVRYGQERSQDQADTRGLADQYAMARGEGPGMVGPQSPDVASAYGMSPQALGPMVRETWNQRYEREKRERQTQAYIDALHRVDEAEMSGRMTKSQAASARDQIQNRMGGVVIPQSVYGQGQQKAGMTPEELAQSIMFTHPGTDPETALNQARAAMNFSKLEDGTAQMLMDPGAQARKFHLDRLALAMTTAEQKVQMARQAVSTLAEYARVPGIPEYDEAISNLQAAKDEWLKAAGAKAQFLEQLGQQQGSPTQQPQIQAPMGPAADPADAMLQQIPQMAGETDEAWAARVAQEIRRRQGAQQ